MLLTTTKDAFGVDISAEDSVLHSLQNDLTSEENDEFSNIMSQVLGGCIIVFKKQLDAYLDGRLSNPTQAMINQTKSAPLHNIFAEATLGLTDHHFRRAPNAKIGFIDGKVRAKKNHTLDWLDTKSKDEQTEIICFVISKAAKVRIAKKKYQEMIERKKLLRLKEKKQKI